MASAEKFAPIRPKQANVIANIGKNHNRLSPKKCVTSASDVDMMMKNTIAA